MEGVQLESPDLQLMMYFICELNCFLLIEKCTDIFTLFHR